MQGVPSVRLAPQHKAHIPGLGKGSKERAGGSLSRTGGLGGAAGVGGAGGCDRKWEGVQANIEGAFLEGERVGVPG